MKNNLRNVFVLGSLLAFLSACGGSSDSDKASVLSGSLTTALKGLSYVSGDVEGLTGAAGAYSYEEGEAVQFSIGGLKIGNAVTASNDIALESLFTNGEDDSDYIKALQVLAVLDADLDSVNGIEIDSVLLAAVSGELLAIDFNASTFDDDYAALVSKIVEANDDAVAFSSKDALVAYQKLEIQTYIENQLDVKTIPGLTLSLELPNGETWHTAAGISNTDSQVNMTKDHKFRIGSATKTFVALLIMQLVDEGDLSLDQTVEEFFPGKFPHGSDMTIKMLLNHTAGVFSFTNEFPGYEAAFGITISPTITDLWFYRYMEDGAFQYDDGALIEIGSTVNTAFFTNDATADKLYLMNEPGQTWNYSNTHYVMLEEIAEEVMNDTWENQVKIRFIDKLDLTGTDAPLTGELEMTGTFATGYINWADGQGQEVADLFGYPNADIDRSNTDPSFTSGSGTMVSTCPDLLKWAKAVMEGELLNVDTQALLMDAFVVGDAFGDEIEMLQGIVHDIENKFYGHRGQIAGYDASWQYRYEDKNDLAGTGTAMAVLLNRTLLVETDENGDPHVSNASEVILEGVLEILYGDDAKANSSTKKQKSNRKSKYYPLSEY